jgi:nitroreductase
VDVFEALYTTRAMRRMHPRPLPRDVEQRILDAAVRAPTGGNRQDWKFVVVDDRAVLAELGPVYREAMNEHLWDDVYAERLALARRDPTDPVGIATLTLMRSVVYLQDRFEDIPLLLFGLKGDSDPTGGSIYPSMWSAQLAARALGVGSAIVTGLAVFEPDATRAALGIPPDEPWEIAWIVAFGYPRGRWGVAARRPVHEVSYRNAWGTPLGYEVPEPLWPDGTA